MKKVVQDSRQTTLQAGLQVEAAGAKIGLRQGQEAPEELIPQMQEQPLNDGRKGTKATALPSPVAQHRLQEVCQLTSQSRQLSRTPPRNRRYEGLVRVPSLEYA